MTDLLDIFISQYPQYGKFIATTAAIILIGWSVKSVLLSGLRRIKPAPMAAAFGSIVSRLNLVTICLCAVTIASSVFPISKAVSLWSERGLVIAVGIQFAVWVGVIVDQWAEQQRTDRDAAVFGSFRLAATAARIVFWTAILLFTLDNLGVNITALIAGLGIGGIAVGLALQNILSDLFSSLAIVLDKPFVVGDFVSLGAESGTIESIGLKTTRVRSLGGEQIICANSDLLNSRIRNYKRMLERRVLFSVSLTYETPSDLLRSTIAHISDSVRQQSHVRLERCHLKELAAHSLDIEIVYWVSSPDYQVYMDTQQTINFEILRILHSNKVEMAYPTQALILKRAA